MSWCSTIQYITTQACRHTLTHTLFSHTHITRKRHSLVPVLTLFVLTQNKVSITQRFFRNECKIWNYNSLNSVRRMLTKHVQLTHNHQFYLNINVKVLNLLPLENKQATNQAFQTQEVITICWYLYPVYYVFWCSCRLFSPLLIHYHLFLCCLFNGKIQPYLTRMFNTNLVHLWIYATKALDILP